MKTTSPDSFGGQRILVPVDFSTACTHGVSAAVALARKCKSQLVLVHVVSHVPHGSHVVFDVIGAPLDWERPARERLDKFVADHIPPELTAHSFVAHGVPYREITRIAGEENCGGIVLSTHGYTGLAHMLIGSTAERVILHGPCPVVVVRGRPGEAAATADQFIVRRLRVPTDFSADARKAYGRAQVLAREFDVPLVLAHVLPPPIVVSDLVYLGHEADPEVIRAKTGERLCEEWDTYFTGAPAVEVLEGSSTAQALCAASDPETLIVMAPHGHSAWREALIGTTAQRVVQHAPGPVMIVR